ncbi:MAG: transposase [Planctomycetota bacterium]
MRWTEAPHDAFTNGNHKGGARSTQAFRITRKARPKGLERVCRGPPNGQSNPRQVIKYLARYLTGGPISDRRLIKVTKRDVTFWARPKRSQSQKRNGMHRSEPFTLSGRQFVHRWSLHILPKNFVRSRSYGGYHHLHRAGYLEKCRKLLGIALDAPTDPSAYHDLKSEQDQTPKCPRCQSAMRLLHSAPRPSGSTYSK